MGETAFLPLLFGGDINVYSVARAFYEGYGLRPVAYGKFGASVCAGSDIVDYRVEPNIEDPQVLCAKVAEFAAAHPDKTVLAMGCGDSYVRILAEHQGELPENVIAPYISGELMNKLGNKESFYEVCDHYGLPHPATFIYTPGMGDDFELPFAPPYICKAANDVAYWAHPFEGNRKGFVLQNREELLEILHKIYAAGYPDDMILQEFVPGDDTHMRVLTSYSGKDGKVKRMCLGHVLLEEHNPHGIGNYAVIMTEDSDELEKVCMPLKAFLEDIGYVGFSNIDMKYDERDGKYKLFEVNCRQGRSNYYVTGCGHNIAKLVVEDWVKGNDLPFAIAREESLFWVVPQKVGFDYVPSRYHAAMKKRIAAGRVNNPLFSPDDRNFGHKLRIWKNHWRNYGLFKQYAEKKR